MHIRSAIKSNIIRKDKSLTGFTLVEMLIVLVILSILSLSLYIVFDQAIKSTRKGEARLDIYQNARVALEQITRELGGAVLYNNLNMYFLGVDPENNWDTDNVPDTICFVTPIYTNSSNEYELCMVKYSVTTEDHILRRAEDRSVHGTIESAASEPLALNVINLQFQYYNGTSWLNTWESRPGGGSSENKLPTAVRIKITVEGAGQNGPEHKTFETTITLPNSQGQ